MHLVGQHSNPSDLLAAVLGWVPGDSPRSRGTSIATSPKTSRLGNGVVQRALIKALAVSDRPTSVCEAQAAVEALVRPDLASGANLSGRSQIASGTYAR